MISAEEEVRMKVVKTKKQQEENDRKSNIFSVNIGIAASITLIITVIKDLLSFFITKTKWLNGILGILALLLFWIVLKVDLGSKIRNKKNVKNMIDVFTFVSIIVFGLENTAIALQESTYDKIIGIVVLAMLSGLCMWTFVWTFFFKKDRKHNMD